MKKVVIGTLLVVGLVALTFGVSESSAKKESLHNFNSSLENARPVIVGG